MKAFKIILSTWLFSLFSLYAESSPKEWTKVDVYKKSSIQLSIIKYLEPVEIFWGKKVNQVDKVFLWEKPLLTLRFMLYDPHITHAEWANSYSSLAKSDGLPTKELLEKLKEMFPTKESYMSNPGNKFYEKNWAFCEIWLRLNDGKTYCILPLLSNKQIKSLQNGSLDVSKVAFRSKTFSYEGDQLKNTGKSDYSYITKVDGIGKLKVSCWGYIQELIDKKVGVTDERGVIEPTDKGSL